MLKNKYAQIPLLKTIIILLTSTLIIIVYLIALHQMQTLYIDDKKTRTQIVESKILTNCFSKEFALIEKDKFKQETINDCFADNSNNLYVEIKIDNTKLYLGQKEDFETKAQFCQNIKSNLLCTKLKYPIILKTNENEYQQKILTLAIIAS